MDVHFLIDMIVTLVGLTFFIPAYDLSKDSKFQCGFPGTPKYGMIKPNRDVYEEGDTVTYSCRVGYILLGQTLRKCKSDGTWTEDIPICDDSMTTLGVAFSTPTVPGHPAELAIDRNKDTCATLKPRSQKELRWWEIDLGQDHKVLSVAITMTSTDKNVNLVVYVIKIMGSTASYKICASFSGKFSSQTLLLSCAEGKGIEGRKVHLADSYPSDDLLDICEVEIQVEKDGGYDCGKPDRNPHSLTYEPEDKVVKYKCKTGYDLEGPDLRTCMGNGRWSGKPPICEAIICDDLEDVENGYIKLSIINGNIPLQGTVANYFCDEGYRIAGGSASYSRICLEDGAWSGKEPHCEAIRCPVPDGKKLGGFYRLVNKTTSMGSIAVLKCIKGKREGDNPIIICTEEGEWTEPDARCLIPATNTMDEDEGPRIVNKGAIIFGMVVAGIMVAVVLISMYVVMQRRRNGNKPELPSRQIESPEAPPRPPPRSKGGPSVFDFISRKGELSDNDESWKTRSLPLNQKGKSPEWSETSGPNRASSYDHPLQKEKERDNKKSSDTVTEKTDSPETPKRIAGREYAAVDYEKKRQSRLLKDQSSEDADSDRIKTPSPIDEDATPPTVPPKSLQKPSTKQKTEDKDVKPTGRTRTKQESGDDDVKPTKSRIRAKQESEDEDAKPTKSRTRAKQESEDEEVKPTKDRTRTKQESDSKPEKAEPEEQARRGRRTRSQVEEPEAEPEPESGRRTRRTRGRAADDS